MRIALNVTGSAIRGGTLKNAVDMAAYAGRIDMLAGQFEREAIMVIIGQFPAGGGMTEGTIRSKLPIVRIIPLVTGIAVGRCSFIEIIYMAIRAGHLSMLIFQFKSRQVMVEGSLLPALSRMAGGAGGSE